MAGMPEMQAQFPAMASTAGTPNMQEHFSAMAMDGLRSVAPGTCGHSPPCGSENPGAVSGNKPPT